MATESLDWQTPMEVLTGSTPDISPLLQFHFYEPVYYMVEDHGFPSESGEKMGRFVGIAETVGDAMTFKILTDDTKKVIYRSTVRSALKHDEKNRRLDPLGGEPTSRPAEIVKTIAPLKGNPISKKI